MMTAYLVYYLLPFSDEELKFELSAPNEAEARLACVEELRSIFGYNIDVQGLITRVETYNKYFL